GPAARPTRVVLPECRDAIPFAVISNFGSGSISIVDLGTNTAGTPIPVENKPWGVAVTSRGTAVYVTNRGSGTLSIVDPIQIQMTKTVPVGGLPLGVAVTPDGTRVYVALFDDDAVAVVDA